MNFSIAVDCFLITIEAFTLQKNRNDLLQPALSAVMEMKKLLLINMNKIETERLMIIR